MTEIITIVIDARHHPAGKLRYIASLLADWPGEVPVTVQVLSSGGATTIDLHGSSVEPCEELWNTMRMLGVVAVPGHVPLPAARP